MAGSQERNYKIYSKPLGKLIHFELNFMAAVCVASTCAAEGEAKLKVTGGSLK